MLPTIATRAIRMACVLVSAGLLTSPTLGQTRPADDSESISLIPSSIKQWKHKLTLDNRSHDVSVQYAVREHTTKERTANAVRLPRLGCAEGRTQNRQATH